MHVAKIKQIKQNWKWGKDQSLILYHVEINSLCQLEMSIAM